MRGSRGGGGQDPLEFAKLNIADITRNEKNMPSYFSYLCTSTVIRQTESIHKTSNHEFLCVCNGIFLT